MKEKLTGLSIKLITGVLLLCMLLCAAISYMGYREFTTVLEDEYNALPMRSRKLPSPIWTPTGWNTTWRRETLTRPIWKSRPGWTPWWSPPTAISSM